MTSAAYTLAAQPSLFRRRRFQLLGGLVVAVLAPLLLRVVFGGGERILLAQTIQWSVVGTAIAFVLGFFFYRRLALC